MFLVATRNGPKGPSKEIQSGRDLRNQVTLPQVLKVAEGLWISQFLAALNFVFTSSLKDTVLEYSIASSKK